MTKLTIRPDRFRQFGDVDDAIFCLVVNAEILPHVTVEQGSYHDHVVLVWDGDPPFDRFLGTLPQHSHTLVISPNAFFESPPTPLLEDRKLIAMACNSTPTSLETIAHFLDVMERTDPVQQEAFATHFFEVAETAGHIEYVNDEIGTVMTFDLWDQDYEWNQQAGFVGWGEQQIVPSGEISVLPISILEFDASLALTLHGELTMHGYPILHNGRPSFTREDQARVHAQLAAMTEHPIVATVEKGAVTKLTSTHPGARSAIEMLEAMFRVDARYRLVWEIGHAVNIDLNILPGNHAMNEVYGGPEGAVHWGLGLTPYTQYHLDIVCPGTAVRTETGRVLLGPGTLEATLASR